MDWEFCLLVKKWSKLILLSTEAWPSLLHKLNIKSQLWIFPRLITNLVSCHRWVDKWSARSTNSEGVWLTAGTSGKGRLLSGSAFAWAVVFRNFRVYSNMDKYKDQRKILADAITDWESKLLSHKWQKLLVVDFELDATSHTCTMLLHSRDFNTKYIRSIPLPLYTRKKCSRS